jgi:hypothetical protein
MKTAILKAIFIAQLPIILLAVSVVTFFWLLDTLIYWQKKKNDMKEFCKIKKNGYKYI